MNSEQMVSDIEANVAPKIRFPQGSVGSSPSLGSEQGDKQLVSNSLHP
jgi:hypothetical protein